MDIVGKSTKTHLYWAMQNCGGDGAQLRAHILNISQHYQVNECTKVQNPRRIQITFVITYVCRVNKFAKLYNVAIIAKIVKSWGIYYYRLSWEFMHI